MKWLLCFSLAFLPNMAQAGQYSDKCKKAGQDSQSQCGGGIGGMNGGDSSEASGIGSTIGSSASINPAAGGLGTGLMDQIGRVTGTAGQCEQEKEKCEKECDKQKQQAQSDQKAQQQGEPGQVDQAKQNSCSQPMANMIGPLLAALASLLSALPKDKNSQNQSVANPATNPTFTGGQPTPTPPTNPDFGKGISSFLDSAQGKATSAVFHNVGGNLTKDGVIMPDGKSSSWAAVAAAGADGGAGRSPAGAGSAVVMRAAGPDGPRVSSVGVSEGGGSGPSGSSDFEFEKFKFKKMSADKIKAAAAGLTKNFNGEPIGNRAQDIFEMIHKAYSFQREKNIFLETTEAPVAAPFAPAAKPVWRQSANNKRR